MSFGNESFAARKGNPGLTPKFRDSAQACIGKNLVNAKGNDRQIISSKLDLTTVVRRIENSSAFGQEQT